MNSEVELVLVDDNNDLVDPLDLGYEDDHINDEEKFQLDDDIEIEEQPKFHLHLDDVPNHSSAIEENTYISKSWKCYDSIKSEKVEIERTISLESFGNVDAYDDTDSDDYFNDGFEPEYDLPAEPKPSPKLIDTTKSTSCNKSTTSNINEIMH